MISFGSWKNRISINFQINWMHRISSPTIFRWVVNLICPVSSYHELLRGRQAYVDEMRPVHPAQPQLHQLNHQSVSLNRTTDYLIMTMCNCYTMGLPYFAQLLCHFKRSCRRAAADRHFTREHRKQLRRILQLYEEGRLLFPRDSLMDLQRQLAEGKSDVYINDLEGCPQHHSLETPLYLRGEAR